VEADRAISVARTKFAPRMVCTSSGIVGATGLEREVGTRKLTDVRQRSLGGPSPRPQDERRVPRE
jgi:hypothetical protein